MIIQDMFLYFAKFPRRDGVTAMATMGASEFEEYSTLTSAIRTMQEHSLVPEIHNYVYGQSLEDLQQRISRLFGSWLYADYGEIALHPEHGSMEASQHVAVTVATKLGSNADMLERMIASDRALEMLTKVHARMMADAEAGQLDWLHRDAVMRAELVPFVATELSSYGWTLLIDAQAPDMLGTHQIAKTLRRL
ncbi:MAG: hypothetical protein IJR53_02580 [Bacteroidales bacterium]|nr:hypothetical protein [Bacteroidales bacterium]